MPVNLLGVALRRLGAKSQPQGGLGPGHHSAPRRNLAPAPDYAASHAR